MQTLDQSRRSRGAVSNLRLRRHPRPPISGGLESLRCNPLGLRGRPERLDWVSAYAATLPADAWMLGSDWAMEAFPGGVAKAINLDAVCGRPAFLPNQAHHSTWVSTLALASKHRLFGHDTVVSKPGGPPSIDPRTLQVEVLNRVRFIGTGRSLYDSCGSDPLGRIARA